MKKITVNYYLNTRLNPTKAINGEDDLYKIYIRIQHQSQKTEFPTVLTLPKEATEDEFSSPHIKKQIEHEKNIIISIIQYLTERKVERPLIGLSKIIKAWTTPVTEIVTKEVIRNSHIEKQIIKFLSSKSKIDENLLESIIKTDFINKNLLKELNTKKIFDAKTKQAIEILFCFYEYIKVKGYKNNTNIAQKTQKNILFYDYFTENLTADFELFLKKVYEIPENKAKTIAKILNTVIDRWIEYQSIAVE